MTGASHLKAGQLAPAATTPGMSRAQAFVGPDVWTGIVRTGPGVTSGWHHHGDHDSFIYVVSGGFTLETADGQVLPALPGDFLHVPPHVVHRESNPADEESLAVLFRKGEGEVVVNVDR